MDRTQALDQTKTAVFLSGNAAFLGCILNHLDFAWDSSIDTACVGLKEDGTMEFKWNPSWFDSLRFKQRQFALLHELWHIALLHGQRCGDRQHELWNIACDIRINNDLFEEYRQEDAPEGVLFDSKYASSNWTEELIYKDLKSCTSDSSNSNAPQSSSSSNGGKKPQSWGTKEFTASTEQVQIVQSAVTLGRMAGKTPGKVEKILNEILKPKLPWKSILHNYLQDKLDADWSWNRPNRRFHDVYLPSLLPDEGRLISIAMFLDTSGSIKEEDVKRFVSEVAYIHSEFKPAKLSVLQFDVTIQEENTYLPDDNLKKIKIKGGGGTSYHHIRNWIQKNKPTLALIFTDLMCQPMKPVKGTDLIWIVKNNPEEDAPQGKTIHV